MLRRLLLVATTGLFVLLGPVAVSAQTDISLSTPFPGIVVEPGSTAAFDLVVDGRAGTQAELSVTGLPSGWTATFRGGGVTVDRVTVSDEPPDLRVDIEIPDEAPDGTTRFTVKAGSASVDLSLTVKAGAAGSVTLTPDFPGLRGPTDGDFTFTVTIANETSADVELQLDGTGPQGWDVTAQPAGQTQAREIKVAAGQTETVNLSAAPATGTEAGLYEVSMSAKGDGVDESLTVQVELIGDLAIDLTTPDQRLNAEVTVGSPSEFQLLVFNSGTAPLVGIQLSATPPAEWEVTLVPEMVNQLAPGESVTVVATITPSNKALAGDYDLSFRAETDQATDSMAIRTTVSPSATWGIVGVALIALTLAGLALVFRRFGRR